MIAYCSECWRHRSGWSTRDLWSDEPVPVARLTSDWLSCARAMERLRYPEAEADTATGRPAGNRRRSPRLPGVVGAEQVVRRSDPDGELAAKLSAVIGAHLQRQVEVGFTLPPRALARSLGAIQQGEMEGDCMRDQWEGWALEGWLEESLTGPQMWVPEGPAHVAARKPKSTRKRPLRAGF